MSSPIMKRVSLELGGNSPVVVLDDADLDLAVKVAVLGKFLNSGQICMSINRLIREKPVYDEFVDLFVERFRNLKVGVPSDPDTDIEPIDREELFGSIAPIPKVHNKAEALQIANNTAYALAIAVFTQDEGRGMRFALQMEAGMTHVNDQTVNDPPNDPFNGEKNSGIGRFGGNWIVTEFTTDHWVTVQHHPRTYPL